MFHRTNQNSHLIVVFFVERFVDEQENNNDSGNGADIIVAEGKILKLDLSLTHTHSQTQN